MASQRTEATRRAGGQGRAASSAGRPRSLVTFERALDERLSGKAPVELRPWRLAALGLLLVAAALYVSPLRAFFVQQDRYQREVATLAQARTENQALHTQIVRMRTKDFITRQARLQYQLVQPGMQAFVVKGLPEPSSSAMPGTDEQAAPKVPSMTLPERLQDLWRTLRE